MDISAAQCVVAVRQCVVAIRQVVRVLPLRPGDTAILIARACPTPPEDRRRIGVLPGGARVVRRG